ncbi:MAG: flippase [Chloroflexi bacterium]|nr:flippase [Chloroflexota bacterium]
MSARAQRIAVNSALLFYANVLTSGVSLVLVAVLARYLGTAGFGRYGYVISFNELLVVLSELGLSKILVREVAQEPNRTADHLSMAWTLRLLLSGLVLAIVFLSTGGQTEPQLRTAIWVYAGSQLIFNLTELFLSVFRAYQRMELQALVVTVAQVLILALTLGAVALKLDLVWVFAAALAANAARFFLGWAVVARRFAPLRLSRDGRGMGSMFWESAPVGISLLLRRYIWRGGVVLLAAWQGDMAAGILYGPLRIVEQMRIVPMSLVGSILPMLANRARRSPEEFGRGLEKSLKVFMVLSLLLAVTLTFLAEPIVQVVLGEELRESAGTLRLLGWAVVFTFPNLLFGTALTAVGRQTWETVGLALGLAVGYLAMRLSMPAGGALAVCWGILAAEGTFLALGLAATRRYLDWRRLAPFGGKAAVAAAAAAGVFLLGRELHFLLQLTLGPLTFGLALLALRALEPDEWETLGAMLPGALRRRLARLWPQRNSP